MRSRNPVTFAGIFGRGLNLDTQPYLLEDGEARACSNVVSTVRGSIRKRDGNLTFATVGVQLSSLYASPAPNFLIGAGGTVLYSIAPAGTVTTIKTGMANGAPWSWINALPNGGQGPLFGVNGAGDCQQWDGVAGTTSAWTALSGNLPSTAKYLAYAGNRCWAAGMSSLAGVADPASAVAFSQLVSLGGGVREWPSTNVVMFDPFDGEGISGIGRVGPYVFVAKPSKLWLVYDLDTGANRPLAINAGCVAHRSIVETPLGTFFLGKEDLWVTDGSTVRPVTRNRMSTLIRSVVLGNRQLAAGAFWNGHYYLAHSLAGSGNTQVLDYDTALDSFWLHTLPEAQLAVWEGDGSQRLYGARGTVVDKLFVPDVATDNGAAFAALWSSPFYTFGQPQLRKRVWKIHFDGTGRIRTSIAKDFQPGAVLAGDVDFAAAETTFGGDGVFGGDGTFGDVASVRDAAILTPGVARSWSVTYGNESSDIFEIDSMTFELADRLRKGLV